MINEASEGIIGATLVMPNTIEERNALGSSTQAIMSFTVSLINTLIIVLYNTITMYICLLIEYV